MIYHNLSYITTYIQFLFWKHIYTHTINLPTPHLSTRFQLGLGFVHTHSLLHLFFLKKIVIHFKKIIKSSYILQLSMRIHMYKLRSTSNGPKCFNWVVGPNKPIPTTAIGIVPHPIEKTQVHEFSDFIKHQ